MEIDKNRMIFDEEELQQKIEKLKNIDSIFTNTIESIFNNIKSLDEEIFLEEKGILMSFFHSALLTIKQNGGKPNEGFDQSEKIKAVSTALGFDFEQFIKDIFDKDYKLLFENLENGNLPDKDVDEETMKFITSDKNIDDYETFLKETKVKETLSFLSKEI